MSVLLLLSDRARKSRNGNESIGEGVHWGERSSERDHLTRGGGGDMGLQEGDMGLTSKSGLGWIFKFTRNYRHSCKFCCNFVSCP